MKPGDHPEFFRLPPPEGRSRESGIRLDGDGRFWHRGEPIVHPGMARAFASWIAKHPDDGRFILTNGYDWSYFEVEDVPLFVTAVHVRPGALVLELFDGTEEPLDAHELWTGPRDALYTTVKGRGMKARFQPGAQLALMPFLAEGKEAGRVDPSFEGARFPIKGPLLQGSW
jgi:hypothetical protein